MKEQQITVWFDFPPERREEYESLIPRLQIPYLQEELSNQQEVLARANLQWLLKTKHTPKVSCIAKLMPDEVQMCMVAELAKQRTDERHTAQCAVLRQLQKHRPLIQRRLDTLHKEESSLSSDEYLSRVTSLAQQLSDIEGQREAWTILRNEYTKSKGKASPNAVLNTGILLCRMMLNDAASDSTWRELRDLEGLAGKLEKKDQLRIEWLRLYAESLIEQCHYQQAVERINELVQLLPSGDEQLSWQARLAEIHMLQGELNTAKTLLGSEVSSDLQITLVQGRMIGMCQGSEAAMQFLDEFLLRCSNENSNKLAIALLKSELLYLDHKESKAQEVFDEHVRSKLNDLPPKEALLLADNGIFIAHAQLSTGHDEFYHLVDQRRLFNVELRDHTAAVHIDETRNNDRHHEALPLCWQQLLRAYENRGWRQLFLSELDMGRECLALGWLHEAAYHEMLCCDKKFMDVVAERLTSEHTHDAVRKTLDQILPASQLVRHAIMVATLLESISDVIPDDRLEKVIEWLSQWAPYVQQPHCGPSLVELIWKAVEVLSIRLTPSQALNFIEIAIDHPDFIHATIHRRYLIRAINGCVRHIEPGDLRRIVDRVLPLALDRKHDFDFHDAINLLCHIAERADDMVREKFKAALYPSGQTISSSLLIQAMPHFGAQMKSTDELSKSAIMTAKNLLLQVQHLAHGEKPAKLGGSMSISTPMPTGNGTIVVHIGGSQRNLDALIQHRASLSQESIKRLVNATLDKIADSENVIANRVALVQSLRRLLDCIPVNMVPHVAKILEPLAAKEVIESQVGMSYADATNPLNPFKMNSGNPVDLSGISLMILA